MKKRSFEMEIFRRLAPEEREAEAERLKGLLRKYKVPARIRCAWKQRIRLGTSFTTGPESVPSSSSELPWESPS